MVLPDNAALPWADIASRHTASHVNTDNLSAWLLTRETRMRARVALDAAPLKIGSTFSLKLIVGGSLGGFAA